MSRCPFQRESKMQANTNEGKELQKCPLGFSTSRGICPLGFGGDDKGALELISSLPRMPLAVLAQHGGETTSARLLSIKGVVFDVSSESAFGPDGNLSHLLGHDASRFLGLGGENNSSDSSSSSAEAQLLDTGLVGLNYDQHRRLEQWFMGLRDTCRAVAVLTDDDFERVFGTTFGGSSMLGSNVDRGGIPSMAVKLHALVGEGDADGVGALFEKESVEGIVDAPCSRTGMTPLLRAVEGGFEEVVGILLKAGANPLAEAKLYDGDDALQLAHRLGGRAGIEDRLEERLSLSKQSALTDVETPGSKASETSHPVASAIPMTS
ncbi:unnamed protein product [Choristocarpus tenellus]